jgi:site-specific DNA-cytosine methylase
MGRLTHGALFFGAHGFTLGAALAGINTAWGCETNPTRCELSQIRFPNLKNFGDIKNAQKWNVPPTSIISAGIPCQPFSFAGKRLGTTDDRYLWPETFDLIKKVKPDWFIFENTPGIENVVFETIIPDLEKNSYETQTLSIPAVGLDAPYRRARIFVIACLTPNPGKTGRTCDGPKKKKERLRGKSGRPGQCAGLSIPDFNKMGREKYVAWNQLLRTFEKGPLTRIHLSIDRHWTDTTGLGGLVPGVPTGMVRPQQKRKLSRLDRDRIEAIGDAVVPVVARAIFEIILFVENYFKVK